MRRFPQHQDTSHEEASREQFADGSALVTYSDGTVLIVESNLAKVAALCEGKPVNYNEPAPSPAK